MNLLVLCGMALLTVSATAVVKQLRSEIAPFCAAAGGVIMLIYIIDCAAPLIAFFSDLNSSTGGYFTVLIKSLGVAVCCQITADICRDCGEGAAASKVELAGKIGILLLTLPLIKQILSLAGEMLS
ncbi:MAG: SpoIIIAC/SpoIIIAD family protein [Eubacteriales bacterium]